MATPITSTPSTQTAAASASNVSSSAPQTAAPQTTDGGADPFHDTSNDLFREWQKRNQDAVKSGGKKVSWDDYQKSNLPGRLEAAGYTQIDSSRSTSREGYATIGSDGSTTLASGRPGPRVVTTQKTAATAPAQIQTKPQDTGKQQTETRSLPDVSEPSPAAGLPASLGGVKVSIKSATPLKAPEGLPISLGGVKASIKSAQKWTVATEERDTSDLSDLARAGLSLSEEIQKKEPDIAALLAPVEKAINNNRSLRPAIVAANLAWDTAVKGGPVIGPARIARENFAARITGKKTTPSMTPTDFALGMWDTVVATPIAAASLAAATPALLESLAATARTKGPIAAAGVVGGGIAKIGTDYANYAASNPGRFQADLVAGFVVGGAASRGLRSIASSARSQIVAHRIVAGVPVENAPAARGVITLGRGIRGIESPIKKDPDLGKVLNIGEKNAPAIESVLADTPHSIYGTVTTYGQMPKPPRITKDIDLFVGDVGAFNRRVIAKLGPDYQIAGQGITRTIGGKTAHAIDTHQIPPGYPLQTKTPIKFEYAGKVDAVDLPFDFMPDRLITVNRLTQEPLWAQSSRKAAAVIGKPGKAGGWKFGPEGHRAKDIPDLIATSEYLIQSERSRLGTPLRNPIRWYRLSRMEKALESVRRDPTLTRMVEDAGLEMPGKARTTPPPLLQGTARRKPGKAAPALLASETAADTPVIFRVHEYPTPRRSPGGGRSSPAPFSPSPTRTRSSPAGSTRPSRPSLPPLLSSPGRGGGSPTRGSPSPSPARQTPPELIRQYLTDSPPSPSGGSSSPPSRPTPPPVISGGPGPTSPPGGGRPSLRRDEKRRYKQGWKTRHTRREVTAPILSVWEVTGRKPPAWFTKEVKAIGRSHFTAATTTTETGTTRTRRKPPLLASLEQPKKKRRKR